MAEEYEALKNHALVADEEEVPTEYALMAKSAQIMRHAPSIDVLKSISKEQEHRWKSNNPSFFKKGGSSCNVVLKPMIKFVKESGCPNATKVNNTKNNRKPTMKYAEMYKNTSQSPRGIPHDNIDDKRYRDSGCSRHMTGNMSSLSEYEPFNEGYVSFGHGRGKITGKGSIKTGKQHKASCESKLVNSVSKPLHTLYMDLFGPTSVSSLNHKLYCLVVTDDFSRFTWTFFLKSKDETSRILRNFITEIENLKDLNVKIIKSDNRGEFRNKEMNEFYSRKGTKEDVHQAVKKKESPLRFITLPNWFHEAQMATSNETPKKYDAILDNNAPQMEQQEAIEINKFLKAVGTQIPLLVQKSPLMTHLSLLQAQQWKM
nr:putative ribonuclease H-like domain-containing protein [Tanacetum cinerariifolium]